MNSTGIEIAKFLFLRPSLPRVWGCLLLQLAMCASVLAWSSYPSYGFLLREALDSSPRMPFALTGTGFLALLFTLFGKWRRDKWSGMKEHFRKVLYETLIPAAVAVFVVFVIYIGVAWHRIGSLRPEITLSIPHQGECIENPSACTPASSLKSKPDPEIQLILDTRSLANTLEAIHTQMVKDLEAFSSSRENAIKSSTRGMTDPKKIEQERGWVIAARRREEAGIRNDAQAEFKKCCQLKAMQYREQLVLKVPGVTSRNNASAYQNIPYPGVPDDAGTSTEDYTVMVEDLRSLASAYEAKLKANKR